MKILQGVMEDKSIPEGGGATPGYITVSKQGDGSLIFLDASDGSLLLQIKPESVIELLNYLLEEFKDVVNPIKELEQRVSKLEHTVTQLTTQIEVYEDVIDILNTFADRRK